MRAAIFIDAGYLYAAGSSAVCGHVRPRHEVQLHVQEAIAKLKETANQRTGNVQLLRIYWYDGSSAGDLSAEHRRVADSDDVKLRLGVITSYGKQKGVDSLIVTDLIDLARNHAIADAVLLSGDEDTRIGVQIAQSFGVRVHLVGVVPCRGNQSQLLRQEADTTTELSKADVETFLTLKPEVADRVDAGDSTPSETNAADIQSPPSLEECVAEFVAARSSEERDTIAMLNPNVPIPQELDGALLFTCRSRLNRWLDETEKHYVRDEVRKRARVAQAQS